MGIYPVALAWRVLQRHPESVTAIAHRAPTGVEDEVVAQFDYGDGQTASLATSFRVIEDRGELLRVESIERTSAYCTHAATPVLALMKARNPVGRGDFRFMAVIVTCTKTSDHDSDQPGSDLSALLGLVASGLGR